MCGTAATAERIQVPLDRTPLDLTPLGISSLELRSLDLTPLAQLFLEKALISFQAIGSISIPFSALGNLERYQTEIMAQCHDAFFESVVANGEIRQEIVDLLTEKGISISFTCGCTCHITYVGEEKAPFNSKKRQLCVNKPIQVDVLPSSLDPDFDQAQAINFYSSLLTA